MWSKNKVADRTRLLSALYLRHLVSSLRRGPLAATMLRNLPRLCSHPQASFSRSFYFSPFRRFPRLSPQASPKPIPKSSSFREEVARSSTVKSFGEEVRYPGIRNQILVSFNDRLTRYGTNGTNSSSALVLSSRSLSQPSSRTMTLRTGLTSSPRVLSGAPVHRHQLK